MSGVDTPAPPHSWGRLHEDKLASGTYTTDWCIRCGTLRGQEFAQDDTAQTSPLTIQYRPPDGVYRDAVPPCKPWPVAAILEPEKTTHRRKTVPRSAQYLGFSVHELEIARCQADCPDGKRRSVKVKISPQVLLDWAIASLPYPAFLSTGNGEDSRAVWVETKEIK